MRVLTVRQPWAWAIVHGGKDVENRVRNIAGAYRGPVAIHAGLAYDAAWQSKVLAQTLSERFGTTKFDVAIEVPWRDGMGSIIGVVDLDSVHEPHNAWQDDESGRCSAWAEPDAFHLVFANARALIKPIPFKGALGLRHLDGATIARINEGLK